MTRHPTGMYHSFIDSPLNDERVIVTRTFSKIYGLAGLRLGYAVASPKTIENMRLFLTQDSLNAIVAEVVGVALDDVDGVKEFVKRNRDDRQEFLKPRQRPQSEAHRPSYQFCNDRRSASGGRGHRAFSQAQCSDLRRRFPPLNNYNRVSLWHSGRNVHILAHLGYVAVVEQAYASLAPVVSNRTK